MASKLHRVNASIKIFLFVSYCIVSSLGQQSLMGFFERLGRKIPKKEIIKVANETAGRFWCCSEQKMKKIAKKKESEINQFPVTQKRFWSFAVRTF